MRKCTCALSCTLALGLLAGIAASAPSADRATPRQPEKLRILVDKVLMADNGWVMSEANVCEIAAAGFNVVSPRLGNDNLDEVRRIAALAAKYHIRHLPWMRGTLTAPATARGKRMVWANGVEQDLYSPNSDELWDWMTGLIVAYARISVECPGTFGVFLDYENYAPNSQGNAYGLSYDDGILAAFGKARGLTVPQLALDKRSEWLRKMGLHEAFAAFQIKAWRERHRKLRQAVDAINPRFQFCVYPAPGTLLMTEALYPEWATTAAPLILADASNYGRPTAFMPHEEALQANRKMLQDNMAFVRTRKIPFVYMGGIDPVVPGADPEFCGRNAAMSADVTDGYWVFYEGPQYRTTHPDYFRWFARANHAIVRGSRSFAYRARETRDPSVNPTLVRKTDKPQLAVYDTRALMREMLAKEGTFEVHEVGGVGLDYLKQLDVVVLQNYNVALKTDSPFSRALRAYVEGGGGLMLAHDTAWFMDSPFPEVATRGYPKHKVEAVRHVVDRELRTAQSLGSLAPGTVFTTEFVDHMIFKPGPKATTVIVNAFGDPVYVLGEVGKGRVAFVGSYFCYKGELTGGERDAFMAVCRWLARK